MSRSDDPGQFGPAGLRAPGRLIVRAAVIYALPQRWREGYDAEMLTIGSGTALAVRPTISPIPAAGSRITR